MTQFVIKIAYITIEVNCIYEKTMEFCRDYISTEEPAVSVTVSPEDIVKFRDDAPGFSDCYYETLALYEKILEKIISYDAFLMHGSVVALDGNAYMFTAKSGVGKTTHTKLWLKNIPGSYVLNGDKPIIRIIDGIVCACGTPWMGKEKLGVNEILPLKGICVLTRGEKNKIREVSYSDVFTTIFTQCHKPDMPGANEKFLSILSKLSSVKYYVLECNMEDEAAVVAQRKICIN